MTTPPLAKPIADQLIAAIGADDVEQLQTLLRTHRLDVNARIPFDTGLFDRRTYPDVTLLHVAVYNHSDNVVKWLIQQGVDIDARAKMGWNHDITALGLSCLRLAWSPKSFETADILMNAKADPNAFMIVSAEQNYMKGIKHAVKAGANVNDAGHSLKGRTALHFAALHNNPDMIDYLVAEGADINARHSDYGEDTPLMVATSAGKLDAVRNLLKHNADPSLLNSKGATIFHAAAEAVYSDSYFSMDELLALLLEQKEKLAPNLINYAPPNDYSSAWSGKTPLDYAIAQCIGSAGDPKQMVSFIRQGAQWQQPDAEGQSILHRAISKYLRYYNDSHFYRDDPRVKNVIEHLLQAGVDPFLQNKEGITAYQAARNTPGDEVFKNHLKPLHARTRHFNPAADALLDAQGKPTRLLQYACYEDLLTDTLHPSNWTGHEKALIAVKLALTKALPEPYATRYEALLDVTANRRSIAPKSSSWLKRYADTPPETRARDE